jgi:hypothetical protein
MLRFTDCFHPTTGVLACLFILIIGLDAARANSTLKNQINIVPIQPPPTATAATDITHAGFTANWTSSSGATTHYLDLSTTSDFSSYVGGVQNMNVGPGNTALFNVLAPSTTYYYRVRAYNGNDSLTSGNSNTITMSTHGVTCNLNIVSGVTENSVASHEACEILAVGPSFIAENGASVSLSSGWEIWYMPGFSVEQGATLKANVCGQSLCLISESPMPDKCHSCVTAICAVDSHCCTDQFDSICLGEVDSVCGLVCE